MAPRYSINQYHEPSTSTPPIYHHRSIIIDHQSTIPSYIRNNTQKSSISQPRWSYYFYNYTIRNHQPSSIDEHQSLAISHTHATDPTPACIPLGLNPIWYPARTYKVQKSSSTMNDHRSSIKQPSTSSIQPPTINHFINCRPFHQPTQTVVL